MYVSKIKFDTFSFFSCLLSKLLHRLQPSFAQWQTSWDNQIIFVVGPNARITNQDEQPPLCKIKKNAISQQGFNWSAWNWPDEAYRPSEPCPNLKFRKFWKFKMAYGVHIESHNSAMVRSIAGNYSVMTILLPQWTLTCQPIHYTLTTLRNKTAKKYFKNKTGFSFSFSLLLHLWQVTDWHKCAFYALNLRIKSWYLLLVLQWRETEASFVFFIII